MKKIIPLVIAVGIFALVMLILVGSKAYVNMADLADTADTASESGKAAGNVENNEMTEEKDGTGSVKMDESVMGDGNADAVDMTDTAVESSETDEEKIAAVDKKMSETLASDKYREMSLSERRELVSGILLQLEQDGYITGLSYNEDSFMYSFEYIDGTLGGWSIKDFSAQDGMLPMN